MFISYFQHFYYLDDIIRARDININPSDILLDEKLYKENYENISLYDISYNTSADAKQLFLGTIK